MEWQEITKGLIAYRLITAGAVIGLVLVIKLAQMGWGVVRQAGQALTENHDEPPTDWDAFFWKLRLKFNIPPRHWSERERFDRERAKR